VSARRAQQDTYRRGQGDLSPFLCEGVYYRTWVVAMAFTVSDFMTCQVVTVKPQDRLSGMIAEPGAPPTECRT